MNENQFPWQRKAVIEHSELILFSYRYWTGKNLLEINGTPEEIARALFEASFAVLSHGMEEDPVYNYGNLKVMKLWERDWELLTRTPSRYSAEPKEEQQQERYNLLHRTQQKGYLNNIECVRLSKSGQRILLSNLEVWDLVDRKGDRHGQAATFDRWKYL